VLFIARSIKDFYPDTVFRISIGDNCNAFDPALFLTWSNELNISWNWVAPADFALWSTTAHPYIATMMDRFKPPFRGDYILMLDADVVAVDAFDELFHEPAGLCGVIAHGSPFLNNHEATWTHLFKGYGLSTPQFKFEHSGWISMFDDEPRRMTPFYLNTGVLFAGRDVYERLSNPYSDAIDFVRKELDSYFFEQIALTLALERAGIPTNVLPLRYNFPNQPEFDVNNPREFENVRFLHFLRTSIVDRERDFSTYDALMAFLSRKDLIGSNEMLRRRVKELHFTPEDFSALTSERS
jgi:hypothetical protein